MSDKKVQLNADGEEVIDHGRKHAKPKTRRDFLSQGYVTGLGTAMAPSMLSLISQRAMGAECSKEAAAGADGPVPFIVLDLAGGSNLAGSHIHVGKSSQDPAEVLASYTTLGIGNNIKADANGANLTSLNGTADSLMFHSSSPMLAGIMSKTSATTRANMDGVIYAIASGDDTSNNPFNPNYWISKAGASGELVSLIGSRNSVSGARSIAPGGSINPAIRPVQIANPNNTAGLVDLGLMASLLSPAKAEKVMNAVTNMSKTQLAKFTNKSVPKQIKDLVECGYINSAGLITKYTADVLDPRQDAMIQQAFGNNFGGNNARSASISKLVLDGLAGAGAVEIGGQDYHGNNREATQRTKDTAVGEQIGQMFEAAALKKKPLVMYVYTDGGVTSNQNGNGRLAFTADNGARGSAVMFVYNPNGKANIRNGNRQVGEYLDNGSVNQTPTDVDKRRIAKSPANLAELITANYLALGGKEGDLAKVVGQNGFANLEKMLSFSKDTLKK